MYKLFIKGDALSVYSLGVERPGREGPVPAELIALDQLGMEYADGCGPSEIIHYIIYIWILCF